MDNNLSFEENMKKLSEIVSELEKGDIPLEKSVELYGEGVKLSALCKNQLDNAKIKLQDMLNEKELSVQGIELDEYMQVINTVLKYQ